MLRELVLNVLFIVDLKARLKHMKMCPGFTQTQLGSLFSVGSEEEPSDGSCLTFAYKSVYTYSTVCT